MSYVWYWRKSHTYFCYQNLHFLQYNSQPSKHKAERVILSVSEISIPSFIPNIALRPMAMQIYLVKHAWCLWIRAKKIKTLKYLLKDTIQLTNFIPLGLIFLTLNYFIFDYYIYDIWIPLSPKTPLRASFHLKFMTHSLIFISTLIETQTGIRERYAVVHFVVSWFLLLYSCRFLL